MAAYNTSKRDARGQAVPPARGRLRRLRRERARRAALPLGRHRRDSRDGRGRGRGRRPAAGERHLRDDRRGGGGGRAADPAAAWRCRCTGASTSAPARTPRRSRAGPRWPSRSWTCGLSRGAARVPVLARLEQQRLRRGAWAAGAAGIAAPLVRHRLGLRAPVVTALAWQAPVALALAASPHRARDAGIYALQMWAYSRTTRCPTTTRGRAAAPAAGRLPDRASTACSGWGRLPTHPAPARARPARARSGAHDLASRWLHWGWFFVPHGTVAYMLCATTDAASSAAATLIARHVRPRAARSTGRCPPPRRGGRAENGAAPTRCGGSWSRPASGSGDGLWQPLYDVLAGNPFAAMPSLHFGTSVMAAHVLSEVGRAHGAVGWAYAPTLGLRRSSTWVSTT